MTLGTLKTCLACLVLGQGLVSHAATAAAGSMNITDFSYRLIDLDPTDGISPSITLATVGNREAPQINLSAHETSYIRSGLSSYDSDASVVPGLLVGSGAGSAALHEDLSITKAANGGISASVSASAQDVTQHLTTSSLSQHISFDGPLYRGEVYAGNYNSNYFQLSAKTALVIEGRMLGSSATDVRSLLDTQAFTAIEELKTGLDLSASAYASIFVSKVNSSGSIILDGSEKRFESGTASSEMLFFDGVVSSKSGVLSATVDETFSIQFSNLESQTIFGKLDFYAHVSAQLMNIPTYRIPDFKPAVPEPSSQMLAVLGLGALAWTRRHALLKPCR